MDLLPTTFTGPQSLHIAEQVKPVCTLTVYKHAVILRREDKDGGIAEYPVDPTAIAEALAAKNVLITGLLTPNTLSVAQSGLDRIVIEYRPAQVTGLWLEGSAEAVRIPLPPLVLVRKTHGHQDPSYELYALKGRPRSPKAMLYAAPLPHVNNGICWGSVARPSEAALRGNSLEEDWRNFLGSKFGSHSVQDKSKRQPQDIRKLYLELHGKDSYPLDDLIPRQEGKWELRLQDLMKQVSS